MLKRKKSGKAIKIEFGKRDKDTDTESGNNNNKDGNGDGFRDFKDNIFLESDKSGFKSEDYINDETNNKKDSNNKDQEDDDYNIINN